MNTNQKAELRTFAQCYECGAHATLTTIDSQFAWLESHKCPAKPMNTDTKQDAESLTEQRLKEHIEALYWTRQHEQQLATQRDHYKAHAERLAGALKNLEAELQFSFDEVPAGVDAWMAVARKALAQWEEVKKQ